jgi:hypothetical protein
MDEQFWRGMKFDGMDGRAITKAARDAINKAGAEMSIISAYDHLPVLHRARIRIDRTHLARETRLQASQAIANWARAETEDATRRLAVKSLGTSAEESRRVVDELRITRLVDSARAGGNAKTTAADLAERANRAYETDNLDEADVLSRAALELGGGRLAQEVAKLVDFDRISADPARARARRDLEDVQVVVVAAQRDLNAAMSAALQDSAKLAAVLGDTGGVAAARVEASAAGRKAKMAAWAVSQASGEKYVQPAGVVDGLPLNLDPRGSPQPDGAHLPEPKE